jgi:hypothetical protein
VTDQQSSTTKIVEHLIASRPMRAYADPGTAVSVTVDLSNSGGKAAQINITVSGYFVDVP